MAFVENDIWQGRNMVLELMRGTYLELMRKHPLDAEPLILGRAHSTDHEVLCERGINGIFCCDDVSAIQVYGRLKEQGARVPEDICIASYGNTDLSRFFTPAITSVDPHNSEMASVLANMLDPTTPLMRQGIVQHVVQPHLAIRST